MNFFPDIPILKRSFYFKLKANMMLNNKAQAF